MGAISGRRAHQLVRQLAPQLAAPYRPLAYGTSHHDKTPRLKQTIRTLRERYERGGRITMVTAYDVPTGRHVDRAGVDIALVGDSLGMVVLGSPTTQGVTLSEMVHHTRAARRGVRNALLIADLPFGSYEDSRTQAAQAARRLVKEAGADAVKLEGGRRRAGRVRAIVDAGIACMGHIGLTPQAYSALGGFRGVGRCAREACGVLDDAIAVERAGAFGVVLECIPAEVARVVTEKLTIPTIGIGAGPHCSGQVLVYHDMLGVNEHPEFAHFMPGFSKAYAQIGQVAHDAIQQFASEVRDGRFPGEEHTMFPIAEEGLEEFREYAAGVDVERGK